MGEDFSHQTRRFSAAILTDCKGNRRSMMGKRPVRRRAAVVNTGSDIPAGLWYNESGYRQKIPLPLRRFRHRKPSHWDAVRGLCQQQSPPFQNGGDCSLLLPFQVQQGRRTPKKSPGKCLGKHLANTPHSCYNRLEKQKCGSLRVLQHPQACTGTSTTYTTANPHRMDYYTTNRLFTQVPVCLYSPALCRQENAAPRAV